MCRTSILVHTLTIQCSTITPPGPLLPSNTLPTRSLSISCSNTVLCTRWNFRSIRYQPQIASQFFACRHRSHHRLRVIDSDLYNPTDSDTWGRNMACTEETGWKVLVQVAKLTILQIKCSRLITRAYKANNIKVSEAEAGVIPLNICLDQAVLKSRNPREF